MKVGETEDAEQPKNGQVTFSSDPDGFKMFFMPMQTQFCMVGIELHL